MRPLTIEIHGTGVHNRGSELMTVAIADRLRATFGPLRLVVPTVYFTRPEDRARYGLYTTWEFGRRPSSLKRLLYEYGPRALARRARMISPGEVDLVLDASGFAYSDQWGATPVDWMLAKMFRPERRHQPLILLPQALGPFTNRDLAGRCRHLFGRAEMVFARDARSFDAVQGLGSGTEVHVCPDFTIGLQPEPDRSIALPHRFVAIVPNVRMLDKTGRAREYLRFLEYAVRRIRALGWQPIVVIHDESADVAVIDRLDVGPGSLQVVRHADPRVLKWVLGRAHAVLASRYHALIAALSQGVPSVGVGWSHKYPELFANFGCADHYLSDVSDLTALDRSLERLADPGAHGALRETLVESRGPMLARVEAMWRTIEGRIDSLLDPRRGSDPLATSPPRATRPPTRSHP